MSNFVKYILCMLIAMVTGVNAIDNNLSIGDLSPLNPATVPTGMSPTSIAITKNLKFAYVANNSGISPYKVGTDGQLSPIGNTNLMYDQPVAMSITPDSNFMYVVKPEASNLPWYRIISESGNLIFSGSIDLGYENPRVMTVIGIESNFFAYVATTDSKTQTSWFSGYKIDKQGNLQILGLIQLTSPANSIAVSPNNQYLYITLLTRTGGLVKGFTIDKSTGHLSPAAGTPVTTGISPTSVAITADNKFLYVTNIIDNSVSQYSIGSNGLLTPLNPATIYVGTNPTSISITPDARFAYVTNSGLNNVSQFSIVNGQLKPFIDPTVDTEINPFAMVITPGGQFAYVTNSGSNNISQFKINQ